jgi:hypothetical protein
MRLVVYKTLTLTPDDELLLAVYTVQLCVWSPIKL